MMSTRWPSRLWRRKPTQGLGGKTEHVRYRAITIIRASSKCLCAFWRRKLSLAVLPALSCRNTGPASVGLYLGRLRRLSSIDRDSQTTCELETLACSSIWFLFTASWSHAPVRATSSEKAFAVIFKQEQPLPARSASFCLLTGLMTFPVFP